MADIAMSHKKCNRLSLRETKYGHVHWTVLIEGENTA
jgi:hypothetical protein